MKKHILIFALSVVWLPVSSQAGTEQATDFNLPTIGARQILFSGPELSTPAPLITTDVKSDRALNINMKITGLSVGVAGSVLGEDIVAGIKVTLDKYSNDPIDEEGMVYDYSYTSKYGDVRTNGSLTSAQISPNNSIMVYATESPNAELRLTDDIGENSLGPVGGIYGYVMLDFYKREEVSAKVYRRHGQKQISGDWIDLRCGNGMIVGTINESHYSKKTIVHFLPLLLQFCVN